MSQVPRLSASFHQWDTPLLGDAAARPRCSAWRSGAVVEVTVIRRFANAPRLVLTVATIGLAQLLGGIELLVWRSASSATCR